MSGKVYFVGSGPGDPDLLTVKALKLIRSCDLVIYDSLVTDEIIALIPDSVSKIAIRKKPRSVGLKLPDFVHLMIENAIAGKKVVRLKSGDPLIFGRTWEEIDLLDREGIEYEIVPGISSSLSSAAFSLTPLTDRRYSSSFAVVTGHEADGRENRRVRWKDLAKSVDTIIVLMGVATARSYCEKLMDAGIDGSRQITAVFNASRKNQRIVRTTLREVAENGLTDRYGDLCTVIINLRSDVDPAEERIYIEKIEATS